MSDLIAQIRERLDGLAPQALTVEFPAYWTDEQRAQFHAEFDAARTKPATGERRPPRVQEYTVGCPIDVPPAFLEPAEPASPEDAERWQRAWGDLLPEGATVHQLRILPPGPRFYPGFEQMRDAILAVLDFAEPGGPWPHDGRGPDERMADEAVEEKLRQVVEVIAENLGIDASGAADEAEFRGDGLGTFHYRITPKVGNADA